MIVLNVYLDSHYLINKIVKLHKLIMVVYHSSSVQINHVALVIMDQL